MSDLDALLAQQATGGQAQAAGGDSIERLLAQQSSAMPPLTADPLDGMSGMDKFRAGIGMGMSRIGRAVGQALQVVPQSSIDESNRLDAGLAGTTAGKIGNVMGQTAAVLPAALIPGAGTYLGATAIGAGVGGLTTEGGLKDRAIGAGLGAIGGAGGKALGDGLGAGVQLLVNRRAAAQSANAGRDAAASLAKDAGYVIPPADTNPTIANEVLNGLSGKIKTAQFASAKNQGVTNDLSRQAVGAPLDQPLSIAALNSIRNKAAQAYQDVASTGTIQPGQAYTDALDRIAAPFVKAAQGFPNAKPSPVIAEMDALKSPQFDAASAVAKISSLRADADAAYRSGNADLGKALKGGANALEDAIDSHLHSINAPADMLAKFRDARQQIAKTYSVQKGLNDVTGDVSAQALAKQLQKGKPLSGDLLTIGQAASAFPKAMQSLKEAPKQLSPLDYMGSLLAATAAGHPAAALSVAARPLVRSAILSGPYQRAMGTPGYQAGAVRGLLEGALDSQGLRRLAPVQGGLLSSRLADH